MRIIITATVIVCIIVWTLCGCTPTGTASKTPITSSGGSEQNLLNDISFEWDESNVLSEAEYNEIKAFVESVQPQALIHFDSRPYILVSDDIKTLSQVGLRGIPVLIDEFHYLNGNAETRRDAHFLHLSIAALLRIQDCGWSRCSDEYFVNIFCEAKTKIKDIINSDEDLTQKMSFLREYGVVALPYVVDEIKKGNTEYEAFFVEIGLHLSTPDFADYINLSAEEKPNQSQYEAKRERIRTEGNPESFNYKVWLTENEDDLKILFKYLDAYCAEYEAQQKK